MSLEHAILGFLRYRPFSGYDLKKVFDTSVQHFWPADQSQIYRTLGRLADRGWAEMEVMEQADRPSQKLYSITEAGREELRRWLTVPLPAHDHRSAPLVQVFFAGQLEDEEILPIFERAAQELRATLERYAQVPAAVQGYIEGVGSPRETFFWMLTLECGISMMESQLVWAESVIERLRNREHPAQ